MTGNCLKSKKGYTLIEILIVISIFTFLIGGAISLLIYFLKNYSFSFAQNESITNAQYALTKMIKDIREAGYSQSGAWPIVEAQDNSFTFYADVTDDGLTDKVRYFLDNQQLFKGVIEPGGNPPGYLPENEKVIVITPGVDTLSTPLFTYYNGNWPADQSNNPLPLENRIYNTRYIDVYLRIKSSTGSDAQPYELSTGTMLQNIKDNL